jgi:mannose-6-phosphate isomerase-like protein (cupin superfamily)
VDAAGTVELYDPGVKRHPALVHLSHDHHHTLVWARRLQQGETDGFAEFRAAHVERHFREEEERVFPLLAEFCAEPPELLARALVDHARIRAAEPGPELGALLEAHVRLEERELFELLQEVVPSERLDALLPAGPGGPVWGTRSAELNATILSWPPEAGTPEHVNAERDVAVVVLDGSGELTVDGETQPLLPGEVTVIPKGTNRRIVAGPGGIRYATVHRRREGLQVRARLSVG